MSNKLLGLAIMAVGIFLIANGVSMALVNEGSVWTYLETYRGWALYQRPDPSNLMIMQYCAIKDLNDDGWYGGNEYIYRATVEDLKAAIDSFEGSPEAPQPEEPEGPPQLPDGPIGLDWLKVGLGFGIFAVGLTWFGKGKALHL